MRFSRDQLDMLEHKYLVHQYLAIPERAELAYEIGAVEWHVKMWFQNRRAKDRRRAKEAAQLLFQQHNAATDVPEQSVAAAPSAAAAAVCAAKSKGRRRARWPPLPTNELLEAEMHRQWITTTETDQ
uniref:Homeobox domain-containing protein n=1 Tax=Globodera rostochiensis TaxID=31243 RepID=A0A914H893_GLORO